MIKCFNFLCGSRHILTHEGCRTYTEFGMKNCEARKRYNRIAKSTIYVTALDKSMPTIGSAFREERDKYHGRD